MTNDKQRERLAELLQEASAEAGKHFRETTKKVLAEKGRFNSATDIDRRNIYEVEADYLLANGVIVPPCKVGDVVWLIGNMRFYTKEVICNRKVTSVQMLRTGELIMHFKDGCFPSDAVGVYVFPTKEEAEQALNNVQNGNSCEGGAE